ncbi:hypothetical protein RMSM_04243 [Rhodopirellula maiorica SM1]|uniref:Uncharacterized protein n=1 Tax=Rhodopirellula maiorica SM1 TaxID=1265738 RepID=M5RTW7_9BACT|nr:hypothetical protein RMSM_04243 [Rhodopirellula maiorica SM1]
MRLKPNSYFGVLTLFVYTICWHLRRIDDEEHGEGGLHRSVAGFT